MVNKKRGLEESELSRLKSVAKRKLIQLSILIGGLASFVILGWLMLSLAYMIPSSSMTYYAKESQEMLQEESIYPSLYTSSVKDSRYDNYTTYYMLNLAVHSSDNPFLDALKSENYFIAGDSAREDVPVALSAAISGETNAEYARYWHGYLVFLKPMLVFFSIREIRLICQVCFFVLLAIVVGRLARGKRNGLMIGVLLTTSYLLFGGAQAAVTLPIFSSFFLSLVGCLAIVYFSNYDLSLRKGKLFSERFILFCVFCVLGALTAYFDFLDNPILTLCMPMALYIALRKGGLVWSDLFFVLICSGAGWVLGYGIMWFAKWVLAEAVAGLPVIESALRQAAYRANLTAGIPGWEDAILGVVANIDCLGFMRLVLGVCAISALIGAIIHVLGAMLSFKGFPWTSVCLVFGLLVASFLPYIWFFVLSNHSYLHAPLISYRTQIAALFPWLVIMFLTIKAVLGVRPSR